MNSKVIYTIVSLNYLHSALTVRESFLRHNKDYDFIIFIADKIASLPIFNFIEEKISQGIDIRFIDVLRNDFGDATIDDMLTRYTIIELNTAVKPYCIKYLFNLGYQHAIYIDPDIYFYQPITLLDNLLEEYDVVITPHMVEPYPNDGKEQSLQTIMLAGIYNFGFIAVKNTENGNKLADFWKEQLFDKCYINFSQGLFTDQKWGDWFPSLFDKVYILKNRGYNAAYWNLHERVITKKDDIWYANDDKLVFYHFSGLDRNNPEPISKYQTRYTLSQRKPDLRVLFNDYIQELNKNNAELLAKTQYYYNYFPSTNLCIKNNMRKYLCGTNAYSLQTEAIRKNVKRYYKNRFKKNRVPLSSFIACIKTLFTKFNKNCFGVNVLCYINEDSQRGQQTRLFIDNLISSSIPFSVCSITKDSAKKVPNEESEKYLKYICKESIFDTNIILTDQKDFEQITEQYGKIIKNKRNITNCLSIVEKELSLKDFYVRLYELIKS